MAKTVERGLPHDLAAEQAVLGAIMQDNNGIYEAQGVIDADDFYLEWNRLVYESMLRLKTSCVAIDTLTVKSDLERTGDLAKIRDGIVYVAGLTDGVPKCTNVAHYAAIVKEKSKLRAAIRIAGEMSERAMDGQDEAVEIVTAAEEELRKIVGGRSSKLVKSAAEIADATWKELEERAANPKWVTGVASGFPSLDHMLTGFHSQELIIVAARPGQGKTSLALNIVANALNAGARVMLFSLEMSIGQIWQRILSSEANVPLQHVRRGTIQKRDWNALLTAQARLSEKALHVCDTGAGSISKLDALARRTYAERGLDLLVVDYLQLLEAKAENRTQEVSRISRALKMLATELQIPVIALSQLNRAIESTPGRKPQLSDLRESGSIEQDADVVLFIHRGQEEGDLVPVEIIIGKQRNGPTGTFFAQFRGAMARFENPTREEANDSAA